MRARSFFIGAVCAASLAGCATGQMFGGASTEHTDSYQIALDFPTDPITGQPLTPDEWNAAAVAAVAHNSVHPTKRESDDSIMLTLGWTASVQNGVPTFTYFHNQKNGSAEDESDAVFTATVQPQGANRAVLTVQPDVRVLDKNNGLHHALRLVSVPLAAQELRDILSDKSAAYAVDRHADIGGVLKIAAWPAGVYAKLATRLKPQGIAVPGKPDSPHLYAFPAGDETFTLTVDAQAMPAAPAEPGKPVAPPESNVTYSLAVPYTFTAQGTATRKLGDVSALQARVEQALTTVLN